MCGKCVVIDSKIANYRRMIILVEDQPARDAMTGLIDQMTKDKAALHPDRDSGS
jgi:hypothetical protein